MVSPGEVFGVIGENASGKTTLLKVIAGILEPDEGTVDVCGRVSALLDLGAGFHPELSGRENLYLYGSILGLSRRFVSDRLHEIVAFAGLEEEIDYPLRTYSAGMSMRLGFALAVTVDPDVLLVDEVFVVGDQSFQQRCLRQLERFKQLGKTIVLVSHDMGLISSLCGRVAMMRDGRVVKVGSADEVVHLYAHTIGDTRGVGILNQGDVSLIFNNGHCKLLWSYCELTQGMAVFSNILSGGRWHTSGTQASWRVVETGSSGLVIEGRWTHLPVTQLWRVESPRDDVVRVTISTTVHGTVDLERQNAGIMLSKAYEQWSAGGQIGGFPSRFNDRPGGWEVMWAAPDFGREARLAPHDDPAGSRPPLTLRCLNPEGFMVSIENSDKLFEGRVVQYSRIYHDRDAEHQPGANDSLSLEIEIGRCNGQTKGCP